MQDVTEQIVRSALEVTRARGTWLERVESAADGSPILVVRGAAGEETPPIGTTQPYEGSHVAVALGRGTPMHASDTAVVLPIEQAGRPIGALSIAGATDGDRPAADLNWARIFGHLAALAYEKVRLLDESRDARRELERVMASRERLIRGFSHDLKNPLGAADGYAALVADGIFGEVNAAQRGSIESLRSSIRRALVLIDDLHELARTETGVVALRRESVHVGELVRSLYEEYRGAAHASGLALGVDVAGELPVLVTDGGRLRQIVGNLLSNAIKYTQAGSVTLRARTRACAQGAEGNGWVYLDVIDTGIGIPPDKRTVIFEEFSRLGNSDKPGAGLGLAISERLAEALGGRILVESEMGAGSTFTVQLPLA
jgi:signal transduction histidine kinase